MQVSLYYEVPELAPPDVDHDLLKDYIAYARANVHPVISEEVGPSRSSQVTLSSLPFRGSRTWYPESVGRGASNLCPPIASIHKAS